MTLISQFLQKSSKPRLALFFGGVICFLVGLTGLIVSSFSDQRFSLDADQFGSPAFVDITADEYTSLVDAKKSFILFVDQAGCITADGLESILTEYMSSHDFHIYRLMYSDMRTTPLYDHVRYYPSAVIFRGGRPIAWLRADADEDTDRFKDLAALTSWLDTYIIFK